MIVCYGLKALLVAPALLQLLLGAAVFAAFALIHLRGPILCASDRDMLVRLFPGKEMRLLRVLGLLNTASGASGAR